MRALVLYATDNASLAPDGVAVRRAANACFSMGMEVAYHRADVASAVSAAYIDSIVSDNGCQLVVAPHNDNTTFGAFVNFSAGELANNIPVFVLQSNNAAPAGTSARDGTSGFFQSTIVSTGGTIYTAGRHYSLSTGTGLVQRVDDTSLYSTWKYTPDSTTYAYFDCAQNAFPLLHLLVQEAVNDGVLSKPPQRAPCFIAIDHFNATGDDASSGTTGEPDIISTLGDILRAANGVCYASIEQGDIGTMVAQQTANLVSYSDVFKYIACHDHSALSLSSGNYNTSTTAGSAVLNQESESAIIDSYNDTSAAIVALGLEVSEDLAHFALDSTNTTFWKTVESEGRGFKVARLAGSSDNAFSYPSMDTSENHHWMGQRHQFGGITFMASIDAGADNGTTPNLTLDTTAFERNLRGPLDCAIAYHHDTDFESQSPASDGTDKTRGVLSWQTGSAYQAACPDTYNWAADVNDYYFNVARTITGTATWVDPGFTYSATDFELSSTQYLTRGDDLTGNTDNKTGLISLWYKPESITGTGILINAQGVRFQLFARVDASIRLIIKDTSNVEALRVTTAVSTLTPGSWTHIAITYDMADSGKRFVYIDGSAVSPTWETYNDAILDYTRSDWSVGATEAGLTPIDGCLSEVYFTNEYLDLSTDIGSFISGGSPVSLGSNGSTPTGTAPLIYLKNAAATINLNGGSGGNFTVNGGPLSACSDTP